MSGKKTIIVVTLVLALLVAAWAAGNFAHSEKPKARTGIPMSGRVEKSDAEWQKRLTAEQF